MSKSIFGAIRAAAFGAVVSLVFAGTSHAQGMYQTQGMYSEDWSRFITPSELSSLIKRDPDVQIIDIRSQKYVKKGTIPGAISMPFKEWRGPKERSGHPPTEEAFEALLGANGLDLERPIVVLHHTGKTVQTGRAAIVYWLLKSGGADNLAILNGGYKAWAAADMPSASKPRTPEPTTVELSYRRDWWASTVEIFGVASAQVEGSILDARLDAQVKKSVKTGKPLQSLPMARFIPASFFMNPLSAKSTSETGQQEFIAALNARGVKLGEELLISVCQTGELSALSWFYASEIMGLENVLYYPDALKGWKNDGGMLFGLQPS